MAPEEKARLVIDMKLRQSGWVIQDMKEANVHASQGVAVREFPTSSGEVDYALFVDGNPVGVIEAKRAEMGGSLTDVEKQSERYAESKFKYINREYEIRFVYEATDKIIRFTDRKDQKYRSRTVFSFHRPETLAQWLRESDTIRNNLKRLPPLDETGFRQCQVNAIKNLDQSFAENRPKALVQMATGAGKTFTAITAAYRLLKYGKMNRILFLVDTKSLGEQAEREFLAYTPNDDPRSFSQLYGVRRLKSSFIPSDIQVCICTIQRMYSILKGEEVEDIGEEGYTFETENTTQKEVVYNAKYPPEFFDCIIVDECHRSIYNVWSQVLSYFDAFIVGLTATPDKRTFAYFDENVVSEYPREKAIVDGVNVGEDIFLIETEVTKNGAHLIKQYIEYRNKLSREKRWKQMDEDVDYKPTQLDRTIVNPSQIRTVIRTFKENLFTTLFPRRKEVPKTLIFAKTDSHAEDIVQIVREEFGEGNDFCRKITYSAENPEAVLSSFRNDYNPRIAVTVDMIATGTDVKPLECLLFMRDVRSKNYFEQMKGRGTRILSKDDLQKVTPSATENKDHFVIVDAVGVTKSRKTDTRPLERKPTTPLKDLMTFVAFGADDEDTLTSLANRLIRINSKLTKEERKEFEKKVGLPIGKTAEKLLDSFDKDVLTAKIIAKGESKSSSQTMNPEEKYIPEPTIAPELPIPKPKEKTEDPINIPDVPSIEEKDDAAESIAPYITEDKLKNEQKKSIEEAVKPFLDRDIRDYIEELRQSHEQIIDNTNIDSLVYAGYDQDQEKNADSVISSFKEFIEENKDEIIALRIIYNEHYKDRPMVIEKLKELYGKLKRKNITVDRLWDCYAIKKPKQVKQGTMAKLTDLISLIRFEMGYTEKLSPFADQVNYNFMQWTFKRNAGPVQFTAEQMEWLRLIKDHIASSLSILKEDLDLTPFDKKGGLLGFYEAFGDAYEEILHEMNVALVA